MKPWYLIFSVLYEIATYLFVPLETVPKNLSSFCSQSESLKIEKQRSFNAHRKYTLSFLRQVLLNVKRRFNFLQYSYRHESYDTR